MLYKKTRIIFLSIILLLQSFFYIVPSKSVEAAPVPPNFGQLISDFESEDDGWYYGSGDQPGVKGSYTRHETNEAYEGDYVGRLSGDFSDATEPAPAFVFISRSIRGIDIEQLSFWVKTSDIKAIKVRTEDNTGQTFHHSLALEDTDEWQQVVLTELTSSTFWGGANDGQWHGPGKDLVIMLDHVDITNGTTEAQIMIDNLTALVKAPEPSDFGQVISDFESDNDGWHYGFGDQPDVRGSYTRLETNEAYEGDYAGLLSGDFSDATEPAPAIVFISRSVSGIDMEQLSFWVQTSDIKAIKVRTEDSSGQVFHHSLALQETDGWQQVIVSEMTSPAYWGGANDGQWHGPAKELVIMLDRADITNGTPEAQVMIDNLTALVKAPPPSDFITLLSDFESEDDVWLYDFGDQPDVKGSYTRLETNEAYEGDYVGRLSGDFSDTSDSKPAYVTMNKGFDGIDVAQIAFWIKTEDVKSIKVRTQDASGQMFHQSIPLDQTNEWQQVVVSEITSPAFWGGANDGQWHAPIRNMFILLDRDDITNGTSEAQVMIDKVTVEPSSWRQDLRIEQTHLGHVFIEGEVVKFPIVTQGDQLVWKATDFWGNTAKQGMETVIDGHAELELTDLNNGYYELQVTALLDGEFFKEVKNTFAILGPILDLHNIDESPFGIATHFGQWWSPELMPLLEKAGIKSLRDEMYWNAVEREKGQYTFDPKHDNYMNAAAAHGIDPFMIFSYANPHYDDGYTPYTEEGIAAFADYGVAILEEYEGQIKWVQVFNEYNHGFSTGPCAQDPQCYFEMLKETYKKVKDHDENIIVVGPSTAPSSAEIPMDWLEELFSQGDEEGSALDYMDAVSVHPYRYPRHPAGLEDGIARLQELIKQYNNGVEKPIWVTEWGWPTQLDIRGVTEETQATYLIQSSVQFLSENVEKLYWYNSMNKGLDQTYNEDNFGIFRHVDDPLGKYAPKPAYVAYSTIARELTEASYEENEAWDAAISSYLFNKNGKDLRVLWSDEPTLITISTNESLVMTDMMGHKQTLMPINDEVTYTLSRYPVFIKGELGSIRLGGAFSIQAGTAFVGDEIATTLQLDNRASDTPMTALFVLRGETYELTAEAGSFAEKMVYIDGSDTEQTMTINSEVFVQGQHAATISTQVQIINPINIGTKHVLRDDSHALSLTVNNHSNVPFELTGLEWMIGDVTGTETLSVMIGNDSAANYDLILPTMNWGAYEYELKLIFASEYTVQKTGKLILSNLDELVAVPTKGTELAPIIELGKDGDFGHLSGYRGEEDLSGNIWLNWDEIYVYLTASIVDDVHTQNATGADIWQGDSIQFSLSLGMPGEDTHMHEFGIALTPAGPQLYRWMSMKGTEAGLVSKGIELNIERDEEESLTHYQLALPWTEVAPIQQSDNLFAFSILINDNDGTGRRGWAEWASGIGADKNTSLFNGMRLVGTIDPDPVDPDPVHPDPIDPDPVNPNPIRPEVPADPEAPDKSDEQEDPDTSQNGEEDSPPIVLVDVAEHWAKDYVERAIQEGFVEGYPDQTFKPEQGVSRAEFVHMLVKALKLSNVDHGVPHSIVDASEIGDWAEESIAIALNYGIINGYADGTVRPGQMLTRTEMVMMIARALGERGHVATAVTSFEDQKDIPTWAINEVTAVVSLGIIQGRPNNKFAPSDTATRAEAVTVILRMLDIE